MDFLKISDKTRSRANSKSLGFFPKKAKNMNPENDSLVGEFCGTTWWGGCRPNNYSTVQYPQGSEMIYEAQRHGPDHFRGPNPKSGFGPPCSQNYAVFIFL